MSVQRLCVNTQAGQYSIVIDTLGGFNKEVLSRAICGQQVMIVTNDVVAPLYLSKLKSALIDFQCDECILPDGESEKTLANFFKIIDTLVTDNHHRDTTVIALGGGVVGDIAGFAAASYQRGVNFLQVPTTLLAQVDSSVGGKTAVNHSAAKNMIGAFWQPSLVLINVATLQTLPEREYRSGFAEVIKAAILADADFFEWLGQHAEQLLARDFDLLQQMIARACAIKQTFVETDETEQTGQRALLNLGHTLAHALEKTLGYGRWLHGEAVAVGLALMSAYSAHVNFCSSKLAERVQSLLKKFHLPTSLPTEISCAKLCSIMTQDKKVMSGRLRMVLPRELGFCQLTADYSLESLQSFLESCCT